MKALAKDPGQRYTEVKALKEEVETYLGGSTLAEQAGA